MTIALRSYGVRLVTPGGASWNNDAYNAYLGVYDVGSALSGISGSPDTVAFKNSIGPMTFTIKNDMNYYGWTTNGNIDFKFGVVRPRLVAHELGHSFAFNIDAAVGEYDMLNPLEILRVFGVRDADGKLVTGPAGHRYAGLGAVENGYCSNSYLDECQYHSIDLLDPASLTEDEDWADMFMNWTYNSFVDNKAGRTLNKWMNGQMSFWVVINNVGVFRK